MYTVNSSQIVMKDFFFNFYLLCADTFIKYNKTIAVCNPQLLKRFPKFTFTFRTYLTKDW